MFVHHVLFWLKDTINEESRKKLREGLETLKAIEPKNLIHIGTPAATNRPVIDTSYDFSLVLIFNNLEEQESYQVHPVHTAFVKNYSDLWSRVLIYDSEG